MAELNRGWIAASVATVASREKHCPACGRRNWPDVEPSAVDRDFSSRFAALPPMQRASLRAMCREGTREDAAIAIGISEPTLRGHLNGAYAKLRAQGRFKASAVCYQIGRMDEREEHRGKRIVGR